MMTLSNRRAFLKYSAAVVATPVATPVTMMVTAWGTEGCSSPAESEPHIKPKTRTPKKALVLWYSQAGHTRRIGRVIAHALGNHGLEVRASDIRDVEVESLPAFELIVVGTPVFYYDVPEHAARILEQIPRIDGIPCASYVTFGGPGNNQHNTALSILEKLMARGGVPFDMATFGNMSTFAPTWSIGNVERVLKYKHLPNEETYGAAREFAGRVLGHIRQAEVFEPSSEITFDNVMKHLAPVWFTKLLIGQHTINGETCIGCGNCVEKCPVNAALPDEARIDRESCIACMGCVNNCPERAVEMEFMGHDVYGFHEFLKQNGVVIVEPELG